MHDDTKLIQDKLWRGCGMTLEVFSPLIEAAKQLENCVNLGNNFQHHVQVSGRVLVATLHFILPCYCYCCSAIFLSVIGDCTIIMHAC